MAGLVDSVGKLCPGVPSSLLETHLRRMPESYSERYSPVEIARHLRLLARLSEEQPVEVEIRPLAGSSYYEVCVVGFDRTGTLAAITTALATDDCDVQDLQLSTYLPEPEPDDEGPDPSGEPARFVDVARVACDRKGRSVAELAQDLRDRLGLAFKHLAEGDLAGAQSAASDSRTFTPSRSPAPKKHPSSPWLVKEGLRLGDFRLESKLATGGMSEVYLATQLSLGRKAAVKIISGASGESPEMRSRFDREAHVLASFTSAQIVQVLASGTTPAANGSLLRWLSMEFLPNGDLATWMRRQGPPAPALGARWFHQALQGLNYAHTRSIVHRDLKPHNLLLSADLDLKISDFGLLKEARQRDAGLTVHGTVMGTPQYISPEQALGEEADEPRWHVDRYSQHRSCDGCGRSFEELSPHNFSFNSPLGWCPVCEGLGTQHGANPAVLIPDGGKSLRGGAVVVWPDFSENPLFARMIGTLADAQGIDLDAPFEDLEGRHRRAVLHGTGDAWFRVPADASGPEFSFQYKGLFPAIEEAARVSFIYRFKLQGMVDDVPCASCMGARLRDDAAAVRFHDFTLDQIGQWPLGRAHAFFKNLKLDADEKHIAGDLIREIRERLTFLVDVGLDYLTLARGTPTLSGGESQRIRLASQIGSGLTGVLYVLDEPTIGLHPRDNTRLLAALRHLRDLGNTLVLVEHDREVIEAADHLVDFGPGSGSGGGEVTSAGAPAKVKGDRKSLTGRYLSGKAAIPVPTNRRPADGPALVIRGARHHNLKDVDVAFPLGVVTVVTGVSGSGKSSLIEDVLWKAAAKALHRAQVAPGAHDAIEGLDQVDKVISVDQTPLGSTPTSTPGTYSGAFDLIRELYAKLPEAKVRGYTPRRFSFNQPGGRCEACEGAGQKRIEMHFLPDVWVTCESCGGTRYAPETLAVKFRGKTIADVLEMTVDSALELFEGIPKVRRVLQTLHDVGLGYVPLGQAAPTLSGGEAQRVKLAAELARPDTGKTLYVLDEPTTGLHLDDIRKLLDVVHRLADLGNTVVIIEHNLEVIKTADWVVDLGPEAGASGGEVVASGPPEAIAGAERSLTGAILKGVLAAGPLEERPRFDPKAAARKALAEVKKAPSLEELTGGAKPPWEVDGRRWHTRDRIGRTGRPARWDGRVLERVVERIEALGEFAPTDWSQRTSVRIAGPEPGAAAFFQAMTGGEWIVTLKFTVARNAFKPSALGDLLRLTPFHEGATPVLSDAERLTVANGKGPTQEVVITCHSAEDLETKGFETFLARAVASYRRIGKTGALVTASELS